MRSNEPPDPNDVEDTVVDDQIPGHIDLAAPPELGFTPFYLQLVELLIAYVSYFLTRGVSNFDIIVSKLVLLRTDQVQQLLLVVNRSLRVVNMRTLDYFVDNTGSILYDLDIRDRIDPSLQV